MVNCGINFEMEIIGFPYENKKYPNEKKEKIEMIKKKLNAEIYLG